MEQSEFKRALAKHQRQQQKRAEAALRQLEGPKDGEKVNTALPWAPVIEQKKKEKPVEAQRPRPKNLVIHVSGPVELALEIDWSGTLMGGQMNEQALKALFTKCLSPMGRVK